MNGAHLKPLDRDDMKPKIGVQWNPLINTVKSHDSTASAASRKSTHNKESNGNITKKSWKTCENFLQSWRTITDHSNKFTYVWNLRLESRVRMSPCMMSVTSVCFYCRNDLQHHVFRVEIPASFLGDFANACLQHSLKVDDVTSVVELLGILSACNRFDLTVCFMTRDEKSTCGRLFRQLQLKGRSPDKSLESAIESLAAKYQVKLD